MKLNKLLLSLVIAASATSGHSIASESECGEECQRSIKFHEKLDEKDQQIKFMQREMEIQRLSNEIAKLKEGDKSADVDNEKLIDLSERIDGLYAEINSRLEELSIDRVVASSEDKEVIRDTTGVDNIFVTATNGAGSNWRATIYYNNSIQSLAVGDFVYPGAVISSITNRGVVVSFGGKDYFKNITSSEIAMARTFNNIVEERALRMQASERELINTQQSQGFMPHY